MGAAEHIGPSRRAAVAVHALSAYTPGVVSRVEIPALLVLPADDGAGKTLLAGAIAEHLRRRGSRLAVSVPVQTGAPRRREGLVSDEAEFLAACADARQPLDLICPQRYHEPLIPSIAAKRADQPVDWDAIDRAIRIMTRDADVLVVQAPAPLMTPLDEKRTVLDLALDLGAPVVLVTRPGLREVHHVAIAAGALRATGAVVAGVVVNRYPAESPTIDQESSLRELERWAKAPLLCVVPEESGPIRAPLPANIAGAIDLVDWDALSRGRR
jgi:dethiobiotin synthetase